MQSAFELLGLRPDADEAAIRIAYHRLVKTCHPDSFQDPEKQKDGQKKLIHINLAYEQAMKIAGARHSVSPTLPCEQSKNWARKLLERSQFELALLQLSKAESKDSEWFALQGEALTGLRQHLSACQAWRTAVRMDPASLAYRRSALDAEMRLKKSSSFAQKTLSQFKALFNLKDD